MKKWFDKVAIAAYLHCQKGQGMVEYGLILALVAVVVIVGANLAGLGTNIDTTFKTVADKLK